MSSLHVRQYMDDFIKNHVPWPYIAVENRNPKPPVDNVGRLLPFVSSLYIGDETAQSIGDPSKRCWRELGQVMVLFYIPSNTGVEAMLQVADDFRRMARGRVWRLQPPHIDIEIQDATPVSDYASFRWSHSIGDYFIKAVSLGYRSDTTDP